MNTSNFIRLNSKYITVGEDLKPVFTSPKQIGVLNINSIAVVKIAPFNTVFSLLNGDSFKILTCYNLPLLNELTPISDDFKKRVDDVRKLIEGDDSTTLKFVLEDSEFSITLK